LQLHIIAPPVKQATFLSLMYKTFHRQTAITLSTLLVVIVYYKY